MNGEEGGGRDQYVIGESQPSRLHEYESRRHVLIQSRRCLLPQLELRTERLIIQTEAETK